ncbi:MAG: hypothetical protein R3C13_08050 [Hyphomonas sp.]|uniref:hypothetical protein n=1 Tax=Hyphomonas sp. TaxID=87 RepID=UPI00352806D1
MLIKGALRCVVAAALASLPAYLAEADSIALQPASIELELDPATTITQLITVSNTERHTISVSLGLSGWETDGEGGTVFASADAETGAATDWVRFSPSGFTLKPGEARQVRLYIRAPDSGIPAGDQQLALRASTVIPAKGKTGWLKQESASLIYLTLGEAASFPRIVDSRLTLTADGKPAIGLDFANDGNAHARLSGTIEVRGNDAPPFFIPVRDVIVPAGASFGFTAPLGQKLPDIPVIEVRLDNLFAPQQANETETLAPYRVKTESGRGAFR